jgi:hypothetical protein
MAFTIKYDQESKAFIARYIVAGQKKRKPFKVTTKRDHDLARSMAMGWLNNIIEREKLFYRVTRDEFDDFIMEIEEDDDFIMTFQ